MLMIAIPDTDFISKKISDLNIKNIFQPIKLFLSCIFPWCIQESERLTSMFGMFRVMNIMGVHDPL